MAVKHSDVARSLRPFTLHAQQVMAQARADVERVPAVLLLVQRAVDHAGLAETFRLLPDLDVESAAHGGKSVLRMASHAIRGRLPHGQREARA
jgi:hypothetical protein